MSTIRNVWYYLIHSIAVLYYRIRGHNRNQRFVIDGNEVSMADIEKMFAPVDCKVCSLPIKHAPGQVVTYHRYCRQFRNNRYGFDPANVV